MTAPALGCYLYSKTRYRADDNSLPVGGLVVEVEEWCDDDHRDEFRVRVVCVHRGRVEYFTLDAGDVEPGASGGLIRRDVIRSFLVALARDEVAQNDPLRHNHARNVLAGVLAHEGDPAAFGGRR